MNKPALKEHDEMQQLSQEAVQILEILDQIENHTAELRKKLMEEIKKINANKVNLKLDNV